MLQLRKNRAAFTLIELLVVVIIVAVLAAVGVPLLSANVARARVSEAESALGSIRTGMRARFAEFSTYAGAGGLAPSAANIGLAATDLDGRFFDNDDYAAITAPAAGTTFCAGVTGNTGVAVAPRAAQVAGVSRSINELGNLFSNATCTAAGLLN